MWVAGEKLFLYLPLIYFPTDFDISVFYVTFQKRVRVFHRVSKRKKHLKPRGCRPIGFIVFERLET